MRESLFLIVPCSRKGLGSRHERLGFARNAAVALVQASDIQAFQNIVGTVPKLAGSSKHRERKNCLHVYCSSLCHFRY